MPIRLPRLAKRSPEETRSRAIARLERVLARTGEARFLAFLMLSCTGMAGLFASWAMLHLGIGRMYVRYPLAVAAAYGVFLGLLWLWIWRRRHNSIMDLLDLPGGGRSGTSMGGSGGDARPSFGGGQSGGGGAGGTWGAGQQGLLPPSPPAGGSDGPADLAAESPGLPSAPVQDGGGGGSGSGASGSGGSGWSVDLDLDDGAAIIAALAIAAAVLASLCASLYVVYIAPHLLADVLFDGVLVVGLYRRLRSLPQQGWLSVAVRHTIVPALLTLVVFFAAGLVAHSYVPEARSIGDIWRRLTAG
jgi:hypothetical protein